MNLRTDLAIESIYTHNGSGITETNEKSGNTNITEVKITTENASKEVGKPVGTYITLENPFIGSGSPEECQKIASELSKQLKKLIKSIVPNFSAETKVLVCGLGNRSITPDALGPECAKKIMVTNHIIEILNKNEKDFSKVSVITPGVMGITGIETKKIIEGVVKEYKPDILLTVDALCAMSQKRMFKTIQLTDTGINPGSGVGNKRSEISKNTLNIPVISMGIPTVVDSSSIIYEALNPALKNTADKEKIIEKILENENSLFVSPKDIDELIKKGAKILSDGINLSLHKNIDFNFIDSYTA